MEAMKMVLARVNLNEYSNRVMNVIRAKFVLKDKSEALNKFVELYGDDVVEKEANDQYIKKLLDIEERHIKKYGNRKMTLQQLDKFCEAK